jgi:ABC-2 type transport system permease protein
MSSAISKRAQLAAIAELQWRMFVNTLGTRRGKMELVSRIMVTAFFVIFGFGGFVGTIAASWYLVAQDQAEFLAIPLWMIFLFWQLFPLMATAFANNPDSSELLRFPLAYPSFFLVRLTYGFFDAASALGTAFTFGILLGVTIARPLLFPWALLVLLTFALFNLVLMQMLFAWIERWLAQRRTREIFGVIFILVMLSFQLIGPIMGRMGRRPHPELSRAVQIGARAQAVLPPGLAADALAKICHEQFFPGLISFLALSVLTLAVGFLLHLRLHAQFRGENLSEAAARPVEKQIQPLQLGWDLPGFSSPVAAVFEKEVRYIMRSGPMLLTLGMPIFMLLVFRLGPMNPMRAQRMFSGTPDLIFPGAAAYTLLILTNLAYNSFGGDGAGVQFFYASPAQFRHIVLGKNLIHAAILAANVALAWIAVSFFYRPPQLAVTVGTIIGMLFAAPVNFTAGNLLSIYFPKKRDFASFGRQNASQTTVLISLGVQAVIIGLGFGIFTLARLLDNLWIAPLCFSILAAISIPVYIMILRRLDSLAIERRETLLAELCRA